MKVIVISLIAMFLLVGVAMAATPKVAATYNLENDEVSEAVGVEVKEDILGVKNLDYDVLIASDKGETLYDDNKVIINGLSYNYDLNEKASIGIGVGLGLERFEKLEAHRLGEVDKYIYCSVSYKL